MVWWLLGIVACTVELDPPPPDPVTVPTPEPEMPPAGPCEVSEDWVFDEVPIVCVATCEDWGIDCQGGDCVLFDGADEVDSCLAEGTDGFSWCRNAVSCLFPRP